MKIDRVTITGADDTTDVHWMQDMTELFPFVEWGILVSETNMGCPRFPSLEWIAKLSPCASAITRGPMSLSMHVCGKWVRQICKGRWSEFLKFHSNVLGDYRRIQLNFHSYKHLVNEAFFQKAFIHTKANDWQLIFQVDGVNNDLVKKAVHGGINAVPLFDLSGGAGIVPAKYEDPIWNVYNGYAGGLGPENVLSECDKISQVVGAGAEKIWIDMETRVRTPDDRKLDTGAVESVLDQMANSQYVEI